MKTLHGLYHLVRADVYERIRRRSFLIILAITIFAGYLFVPPADAGYRVLQVGAQRGIYNSQWIGLMFGLIAAMHLPLVGFYLVKNTVERDRLTGVGQIIATTPVSKVTYVVGKWLSNLAILTAILGAMTVMAAIMQLLRGEDAAINVWVLLTWIWLMGMPVLALAAAMAVLFECVSFLRRGLGNVIYFAIWLGALISVLSGSIDEATGLVHPTSDLYGFTRQMADIQGQVMAADPDAEIGSSLVSPTGDSEGTFVWEGSGWKPRAILERVIWLGIAGAVALVAAIPFDRFDPARRRGQGSAVRISQLSEDGPAASHSAAMADRIAKLIPGVHRDDMGRGQPTQTSNLPIPAGGVRRGEVIPHLTPLIAPARGWRFFGVFAAELKLMLKGQSLFWYAGALALNLACLLNPSEEAQRYLLSMVWIWPILVWSQMGVRERRFGTEQMLFSVPRPALRQLPATWLAGVAVAIIAGSGAWLFLALHGEMVSLLAWLVGALFVPALSLALGVWAGNSRAFEAAYLLWWYAGLIEQVPALDYAGATAAGLQTGVPLVYLGISAALVAMAVIRRRQQIQA
ncbi:MAG: ABC transporter permease [Anaerolineae bacterium]|jgi:ABC-type transport system involved in multi-copper enzyme maturation permease subunit